MLKPYVDAEDDTWRAEFEPTNWSEWFASYQTFIWHYAEMAENYNIELFCVGCEYKSSDADRYENWSITIEGIRTRYSGKIIYSADWSNYGDICFWNLLDFIGIDAYFPLFNGDDPALSNLINGWNDALDGVEDWLETSGNDDKDVIFSEVGYESQPKCWKCPGDTGSNEVDVAAQDLCYQALFSTIPGRV